MKYLWVPPQRKFFGPVHWGHTVLLNLKRSRYYELVAFLDQIVGVNAWRLSTPWDDLEPLDTSPGTSMSKLLANTRASLRADNLPSRIKFLDENHAMRVKLMWDECDGNIDLTPKLNSVIIPIIRKVMPQVIAEDIIGVSPMQAPNESIFAMRRRYAACLSPRQRALLLPKWKRRKRRQRARL